jgi:hypothetical protein
VAAAEPFGVDQDQKRLRGGCLTFVRVELNC